MPEDDRSKPGKSRQASESGDAKFKALMDASPDPIVVYDAGGNTTYMNPAFETVYGFSPEDVMGQTIDYVPADERGKTLDAWQRAIQGEKLMLETRRYTKDGRTLHVQMSTAIIRDDSGQHLESIVIHRDITPLKEAETLKEKLIAELRAALKRVQTLSGLVPICSNCKKIRDDKGYWNHLEQYIEDYSEALFSHGICPDCSDSLYGGQDWYKNLKKPD